MSPTLTIARAAKGDQTAGQREVGHKVMVKIWATRIVWAGTAAVLLLQGCADRRERPLSYDRGEDPYVSHNLLGETIKQPVESFDGVVVKVVGTDTGLPNAVAVYNAWGGTLLEVRGEGSKADAVQTIEVGGSPDVQCPPQPSDNCTDPEVLKAISGGGNHISGRIFRSFDYHGAWLTSQITITLTPEQDAAITQALGAKKKQAEERAAAQRQQWAQAAAKEAAERKATTLQHIREWRAKSPKPPLPERADRNRVLAENAVREKQFDAALRYYANALSAYPFWPEGHYNAALISAEQNDFAGAVSHMQWYVHLVPEAQDAKLAREKIIVWEEKANERGQKLRDEGWEN